ncbi:MAG: hypothetical protein Q8P18_13365 [Pseudomonadota bacterium]|nr:hypothetical protein [Pseudomonadota bacterium]
MANIDIEQRPKANILPWLVALAILVVVVGWLLWRNNRIPDVQGRLDAPSNDGNFLGDAALAEALVLDPQPDLAPEPETNSEPAVEPHAEPHVEPHVEPV